MLSWIREKFGTTVIMGVISFIGFVFVFSGVFNPKATRGLHEGAVAGKVNGASITLTEFNRAVAQRTEFFKSMLGNSGGNIEDQIKNFRIKEAVFQDLVRRKLLVQESGRAKMDPSDEEVRAKIQEIPAFQNSGKFDVLTYKRVLAANNYTPDQFERMVREDLAGEQWNRYFQNRVYVSEAEAKKEFLAGGEKRNIKYVLLTSEAGKKGVKVDPAEVTKFLADPGKVALAQNQFNGKKAEFKDKTFDQVKAQIAHEILAGEKIDEVRKVNESIADKVLPLLTVEKASDARVNALLKEYGAEVKTTGPVSKQSGYLPGIGEARDLLADAFSKKSPIDATAGGKAKKYTSATWIVIGLVIENQKADLAKFEAERQKITAQLAAKKERERFNSWMQKLTEKASIDPNPEVVGESS